jgi:hypothetical protein
MKIRWTRNTRSAALAAACFLIIGLSAAACGPGDTYAEQHSDFIQFDCEQTAPCDPTFSQSTNPVSDCVEDTGTKLNEADDAFRSMYEARINRCSANVGPGCRYYDCASDSMLYSIVHETQLRNECQQTVMCKVEQGTPAQQSDIQACFNQLAQTLDFASQPEKAAWEQRATRCGTLTSCAYINCR